MVSLQMRKHHRRTGFKRIPSRATIHIRDQHQNFKGALQAQYQKKTGEMKKQKEKYENAKEKLMEMGKIYNELKVNN